MLCMYVRVHSIVSNTIMLLFSLMYKKILFNLSPLSAFFNGKAFQTEVEAKYN